MHLTFFNNGLQKTREAPEEKSPNGLLRQQYLINDIEQEYFKDFLQAVRTHLNQQHQVRLYQVRATFTIALITIIISILLVFAGIVCIYLINLPTGTVTAVSGIVINIITVLVFRFNKEANDRLENIARELSLLDRTSLSMHYIGYIVNKEERDRAIIDLTKRLYTLTPSQDNTKQKSDIN